MCAFGRLPRTVARTGALPRIATALMANEGEEQTGETRKIRVQVIAPPLPSTLEAAEVVAQVENVSRADAPSQVIAEERHKDVKVEPGAVIPLEIEVPAELVEEGSSYSVRVHVDVGGTGEVEVGDLVSTTSNPVLTRGHGDEARVEVKVV
jgi:putative lipoprotein